MSDEKNSQMQMVPMGTPVTLGASSVSVTTSPDSNSNSTPPQSHPKTMFSDDKGNLKVVNLIIRSPCIMLLFVFGFCLLVSFLLFSNLNEIPITDDSHAYDIWDVRSSKYDSLLLTRDKVFNTDNMNNVLRRSRNNDINLPVNYTTRPNELRGGGCNISLIICSS